MDVKRATSGVPVNLSATSAIGSGGEARIFAWPSSPNLVAKIYHKTDLDRAAKLGAMIANPPDDPTASQGHVSIAWPIELLISGKPDKSVVGFLMPRIGNVLPIFQFYNPRSRKQHAPLFHFGYLLRTARNLAATFQALHNKGYVVGDVNESNILVADTSLISLVDTDSFQVIDPATKNVFRCNVAKPEYLPPELQAKNLSKIDRGKEHDAFGLGVLIFQLLMEGYHPFAGTYSGSGDPPLIEERIRIGHFPYSSRPNVPYTPPAHAPSFSSLPKSLQKLFKECFEDGHFNSAARPNAHAWRGALEAAENELAICGNNAQHLYAQHVSSCPWCDRKKKLAGRDPFPSLNDVNKGAHQKPLPSPAKQRKATQYSTAAQTVPPSPQAVVQQPHKGPPIGKIAAVVVAGLLGWWLIGKSGSLLNGKSPISFTNAVVAQSVENNQPIGVTSSFANAPASPVFFASYVNARTGDDISISVWNDNAQVVTCKDVTAPGPNGNVWCSLNTSPLSAGSYSFHLAVNGQQIGTYPFTVGSSPLQPAPTAPSPSFDCSAAVKWSERQVCATPSLIPQDVQMATLYKGLLDAASEPDREALRTAQRQWLMQRDACEQAGDQGGCLTAIYADRIAALNGGLSSAETLKAPETASSVTPVSPAQTNDSDSAVVTCTFVSSGEELQLSRSQCRERMGLIISDKEKGSP